MKNQFFKIIVAAIITIIIIIIAINITKKEEVPVIVNVSKIDNYEYLLKNNSPEIYKKYYKELEKVLNSDNVDENKYVELISKLYIIDFYTLNNKITNQDVGGLEFLHTSIKDNFYDKAVNTIYKYIKSNLYGNRNQQLPEVKDVEIINISQVKYNEENTKDDNAYKVELKINYVKDLGYKNHINLVFVHEDNKLSLVESVEI